MVQQLLTPHQSQYFAWQLIPITDRNSNNTAFIFGRGYHGTEGKWDGAT